MLTVTILKGLPGSGKTTWAKEQLAKSPGSYKRINKDDLRAMLDNSRWSKENEKFVLDLRDHIMVEAIRHGKHVIIDDTNFNPVHEVRIRNIIEESWSHTAEVIIKEFDIPLEVCIQNDLKRENSVGEKVIKDMWKKYIKGPDLYKKPYVNLNLNPAIIVDIDGTLAHRTERDPYDFSRVKEDILDLHVWEIVTNYERQGIEIILLSGRSDICKKETEEWLKENRVPYNQLYMRADGDNRKDTVVKKELYENHIFDKWNVMFVLDDRNSVVEMWREECNLKCLQVEPGDF